MAFMEYLKEFEKNFKKEIVETKDSDCGKGCGKFSSPASEMKNPVKTNSAGQKVKGTSTTAKTAKKVGADMKNPVKTGMTGKKPATGSGTKFKNPKPEMGGKTTTMGKKPDGAGKAPNFKHASPPSEMKNPVKTGMTKSESVATSKAAFILEGLGTSQRVEEVIQNDASNSSSVTSKAANLL